MRYTKYKCYCYLKIQSSIFIYFLDIIRQKRKMNDENDNKNILKFLRYKIQENTGQ